MRLLRFSRLILTVLAFGHPQVAIGQTPDPLPIDVPAVQIQGSYLVNGAPASSLTSESARLRLDGMLGLGSGFPLGRSYEQSYGPLWVIPTDYQAGYGFDSSLFGTLPINDSVPIGPFVYLDGSQAFDIDVPAVGITVDVTLNGSPFGVLFADDSELLLRHVATGDEFVLGSTLDQPLFAWVVPGTYDLVYRHISGRIHPANTHATIAAGLDLSTSQTVSFDLEAWTHQQVVRLNGVPFPASPTEYGHVALESPDGRDRVDLGPTLDALPEVFVLAGTYWLAYEHMAGGTTVPVNHHAVVDPAVVVQEPAPGRFVSFDSTDVQTGLVSLEPTLDGAPFVVSATNWAEWAVVDADGDETPFGDTLSQPYLRSLVNGTYDVLYQWQNGYSIVPRNPNARVAAGLVVGGPTTFAFDVPMVALTLEPLLNGAPWLQSPTEYGDLYLQGSEPNDRFLFGATLDGPAIQGLAIAGTYDLIYDFRSGGTTVPINENEPVLGFHTSDGPVIGIDVAATRIAPAVTLDGQPFPTGGGNQARIVLRSWAGGETPIGTTDQAPIPPRRVIDGVYRVDYEWLSGSGIPRNSREPVAYAYVPEPGSVPGLASGAALLAAIGRRRVRSRVGASPKGS
jgi:hypothetical protein